MDEYHPNGQYYYEKNNMIYSCTRFFNEFELLELKINEELMGGVDQIIICEGERTFSNTPKDTYLNKIKLPDSVKVVCVKAEEFNVPDNKNCLIPSFQRDAIQRNAALKNISIQDDDIIIGSDIDEIFPCEDIPLIVESAKRFGLVHLWQNCFYYKINLWSPVSIFAAFAVTGKFLRSKTLGQLRIFKGKIIDTNGKHFSYMMSPEKVLNKLYSFNQILKPYYVNFNSPNILQDISEIMKNKGLVFVGEHPKLAWAKKNHLITVEIDESYPKFILNNLEKWNKFIEHEPVCKFSQVKKHPQNDHKFESEMSPEHLEFYKIATDNEITFPWGNCQY